MVRWWHSWRIPILSTLGFAVVLVVGYVTGSMSWEHIVHVGDMLDEPSAGKMPFAVDGMMLAGAIMAWIDNMRGYRARGWSIVALWVGSVMTLSFNLLSAHERGYAAMGFAMVPAITFLVTVEAVFHPSTRVLNMVKQAVNQVAEAIPSVPVQAAETSEPEPEPQAPEPASEPVAVEAPAQPSKPRRKRSPRTRRGYPGTGVSDAALDQALITLTTPATESSEDGSAPVLEVAEASA